MCSTKYDLFNLDPKYFEDTGIEKSLLGLYQEIMRLHVIIEDAWDYAGKKENIIQDLQNELNKLKTDIYNIIRF